MCFFDSTPFVYSLQNTDLCLWIYAYKTHQIIVYESCFDRLYAHIRAMLLNVNPSVPLLKHLYKLYKVIIIL